MDGPLHECVYQVGAKLDFGDAVNLGIGIEIVQVLPKRMVTGNRESKGAYSPCLKQRMWSAFERRQIVQNQ